MINLVFKPILEALPENNRLERIWVLAKTDFLKRYYGSFLGVIWALINPFFQILIYYTVFTLAFNNKQENFALFLYLGLVVDLFFAETSRNGLYIIQGKIHVLENIKINRLDIYFASTLSTFFAFTFNFVVFLIISQVVGSKFYQYAFFWAPVLLANLLVFSFSVQIILSIIHIYLRDIVHLWDMMRMMILWFSGVFYAIDLTPGSQTYPLAYLTPLAGIIYNLREVLIYGAKINLELFVYDWIYTMTFLVLALYLVSRFSSKALEKI